MEDKRQAEFLIDKLLIVSERTIESLMKLKEELSTSSRDHIVLKDKIDATLNAQKDLKSIFQSMKERLFDNEIEKDITTIKTIVENMRDKDNKTNLWVKVLTAITTILVTFLFIYKVAFEKIEIKNKETIIKIIEEYIKNKV